MKIKEIRDLIDFISQSELNEVNIETTDFKISVKKNPDINVNSSDVKIAQPSSLTSLPNSALQAEKTTDVESSTEVIAEVKSNLKEVRSPMIGTFYRAANPESPSFVEIGDHIKTGQTVCIIEAMKLFNEIEAEFSGAIVEILVENATPVEFDQPLFLVDPTK
jgi:acetyl-CoA carboxylase biotin carboxyl carrier protein